MRNKLWITTSTVGSARFSSVTVKTVKTQAPGGPARMLLASFQCARSHLIGEE